jgi:hypothetical protein
MASVVLNGSVSGSCTITAPSAAGTTTLTLPATTGNVIVSTAVSASVLGTVTNKIAINIDGTTYYLLASTSGI